MEGHTMPKPLVLVTGSNRGIGRELVAQLADRGHTVLVAARSHVAAAETAVELTATQPHRTVVPIELDVNNPESVTRAADSVRSQFGSLDILVNNAAIHFDAFQNATDADLGIAVEALQTNLIGTWRVIQASFPCSEAVSPRGSSTSPANRRPSSAWERGHPHTERRRPPSTR